MVIRTKLKKRVVLYKFYECLNLFLKSRLTCDLNKGSNLIWNICYWLAEWEELFFRKTSQLCHGNFPRELITYTFFLQENKKATIDTSFAINGSEHQIFLVYSIIMKPLLWSFQIIVKKVSRYLNHFLKTKNSED